jgi:dTDP-glucose pyrophosphorylase
MKNWEGALIGPATTLREALAVIDAAGCQIALIVDGDRRLLGLLSDGDARRAFLRGMVLSDTVEGAMHKNPTCAKAGDDRYSILTVMRSRGLQQLPIVDQDNVVVGLEVVSDFLALPTREQWVVVMAGGLGTRLEALTRDTPKPMLKVGSRPLLETVLRAYSDQGFRKFYLAVNYKAEQIEAHFGDGSQFGVHIRYLREEQPLGTAGALSLIRETVSQPWIVTNADLLTKENFGAMVDKHVLSGADATMAVREYEMQVPFGVVRERDGTIESIEEKPVARYVISAGMYVLSENVLTLVPQGQRFDMPALFDLMVRNGMRTRCHYIDGYWLDIGRVPDYERAKVDFAELFR